MSGISVRIRHKDKELNITNEGVIGIIPHNHPPLTETIFTLPFREYFTDGSTNDMTVNGSLSTPVEYYIEAHSNNDIFIKYISIEIGDGGNPTLNKFGALSALTNGIKWTWTTQSLGEYELHEGIKTNKSFIRIGGDTASIGTGVDAFLADVSGGGTEKSYLPNIDMSETFGMPYGLRLRKGTKDRVSFIVQDNLTGLTTFDIIGYGIRI